MKREVWSSWVVSGGVWLVTRPRVTLSVQRATSASRSGVASGPSGPTSDHWSSDETKKPENGLRGVI
jgi:hypothetical protein